jgi:hypothetical protein
MKQLKHTSETLETWAYNMPEKHLVTLEIQHRPASMTYLVGNYGGVGSLDGACPHAPTIPIINQGRGDAIGFEEGAAGWGRGGSAACLSPSGVRQRLARGAMECGEG